MIIVIKEELEKILGFEIEPTDNPVFGDYTSNIALSMFSNFQFPISNFQLKSKLQNSNYKNPRELAEKTVAELKQLKLLNNLVDKIEIAGPGFINFWLKKDVLVDNLIQIDREKDKYGTSDMGKGKTVVIDYSSPNIAKPFGIGHLRSTIIGAALYNLYKSLGYDVIGDNHLGDWGTQFGKLLAEITNDKLQMTNFTIADLEKAYVKFHEDAKDNPKLEEEARVWFKKLEEGDPTAKKIWQECVDVSLKEFDRVYKILGVKIDFAFGESYYESEMKSLMVDPCVQRFLETGEDGAKIIDLTQVGIKTPLMFLKSDGATTYATRDLATIKFRVRKWNPSIIVYEVGAEQTLHFQQVFAAARLLKLVDEKVELVHTAHGLYLAPDGKKFSTRQGKTVKLEEVLDEAIKRAEQLQKDRLASDKSTAKQVGIGAIKYYDLMHSVQSNVVFDWEKMMNLEGNSGPYLQYTVARCNSVIEKANDKSDTTHKSLLISHELNPEELLILRSLIRFSEVIEIAAKNYSPNLLCNYLYDLAQKFNSFYAKYRILGLEDKSKESFRLLLTQGTAQVLKNSLRILGIQAPEKM